MSVLRETIRRLLLENNDHYEKLAVMLCSGDRSQIVQAIELEIAKMAEAQDKLDTVNVLLNEKEFIQE